MSVAPVTGPYEAAPGGASCADGSSDAVAVRASLTRVRAMAGLPPLDCSDAAQVAAQAHADYLDRNHLFAHLERQGLPGFTGSTPCDRLASAGYPGACSAEVASQVVGAASIDGIYGYLNSVYHRPPLLRIEAVAYGYGGDAGVSVIDFGASAVAAAQPSRVIWPPDGASDVPTTFHAGNELPNPVAPATTVGSPVSVVTNRPIDRLVVSLVGPDGPVDGVLITAQSDPNALTRAGEAHLVPKAPLAPSTAYRARFELVQGDADLVLESRFTTAPE